MRNKANIFLCASNSLSQTTSPNLDLKGFSHDLHCSQKPAFCNKHPHIVPISRWCNEVPQQGFCTFGSFGATKSMRWHFFFLSKATTSGHLCSIWSVWMLKSQRILTSSVSATFSSTWSYNFAVIRKTHFRTTHFRTLILINHNHLGQLNVSSFVLSLGHLHTNWQYEIQSPPPC